MNSCGIPSALARVANVDPTIAPIWAMDMINPYAPFACSKFMIELVNDQNNDTINDPYDSITK